MYNNMELQLQVVTDKTGYNNFIQTFLVLVLHNLQLSFISFHVLSSK